MKTVHRPLLFRTRRRLLGGSVASATLVLMGCGSGSSSDQPGILPGDGSAGIGTGGTGSFSGSFASGPIRGFGSIIVGSVHYDEAGAQILGDDGQPASAADLRLGMTIDVSGSEVARDAGGRQRARASSIHVRSEIEGPVTAVDIAASTFTVLGQVVRVTASTVFDDDLRGGLAALRVGQVVEVHGLLQGDGRYTATRIDDEDDTGPWKLRGRVSEHDGRARRLRIGTTTISYADLADDFPDLAEGRYVRVEFDITPDAGGTWNARRLDVFHSAIRTPAAGGVKAEIEGYITSFSGPTRFAVNGIEVDASGARWLPAGLGLGVRVEIEGTLGEDGVLIAREVEIDDDDDEFEIEGSIASVFPGNQTFVVLGVTVDYSGARFSHGTASGLAPGVRVEVEGRLAGDGTTLVASKVEFDDDTDDEYEIEGVITSVSPGSQTFVVAGITVDYAGARFFGGTAAQLQPGIRVEVEGALAGDGRTLVASEVEFDD